MSENDKPKRAPDPHFKPEEQAVALKDARALSDSFYAAATRLGMHAIIEHTGLINEHLKMLQRAHDAGCDLLYANKHSAEAMPPMPKHEAEYLAEKFMCMFAPFFDDAAWAAFLAACERERAE